jgi:hypothetical protein
MRTLAVAATLFALALPVYAAPPSGHGPGMGQGPMMGADRGGMGMMGGMCAMGMGRHTEGALAYLKAELKITPAQAGAWDAFAAAYRDAKGQGGRMPMMPGGMMMGGGKGGQPFPERMGQHAKMMEAHLAEMKKLQAPLSQLYAMLSADQKRTADEIFPMMLMCRMM